MQQYPSGRSWGQQYPQPPYQGPSPQWQRQPPVSPPLSGYQGPPYQQQPPTPPTPPKKKPNAALGCGIIIVIVVLCSLVSWFAYSSSAAKLTVANTPTQVVTPIPTAAKSTNTSKSTPTPKPTTAKNTVTHGSPHLGGPISDFYGKYGSQLIGTGSQSGSSPSGRPSISLAWMVDSNNGYLLSVQYYTDTRLVYYIDFSGPTDWSKAKFRDYLIANFSPPGTVEDSQTNQSWQATGGDPYNPIAYTSNIGKFFLHITDGDGNMNTV